MSRNHLKKEQLTQGEGEKKKPMGRDQKTKQRRRNGGREVKRGGGEKNKKKVKEDFYETGRLIFPESGANL